jgi:hypothetical protein
MKFLASPKDCLPIDQSPMSHVCLNVLDRYSEPYSSYPHVQQKSGTVMTLSDIC